MLVPGVVGISIMFQGVQSVALHLAQEFGFTREIEDRVQAPCPIWLVAVAKVLSGAVQGAHLGGHRPPHRLGGPRPGRRGPDQPALVDHPHPGPAGLRGMTSLGLLLGTTFEPRNIGLMFGFVVLPITFLGGTYYQWTRLAPVKVGGWHWLQTIVLVNPLIYVNEGHAGGLHRRLPHAPLRRLPGARRLHRALPRHRAAQLPAAGPVVRWCAGPDH